MFKVGFGFDIHRLIEGRKLFLGGVEIPYLKGLLGHSDGDALLHALSDAILGAIGKEDIGELFPDTDSHFEGIASEKILEEVLRLMQEEGFRLVNVDTVIIAEEPKLTPFKKRIQENLSRMLKIEATRVGIKAKTYEGLSEIGKKEAIACYAVVLVEKSLKEEKRCQD